MSVVVSVSDFVVPGLFRVCNMLCFPTPIDRDATTNFGREKPAGQTLHHEQTRAPGDADTGSLHSDPIVYPEAEERDGDDLHDD